MKHYIYINKILVCCFLFFYVLGQLQAQSILSLSSNEKGEKTKVNCNTLDIDVGIKKGQEFLQNRNDSAALSCLKQVQEQLRQLDETKAEEYKNQNELVTVLLLRTWYDLKQFDVVIDKGSAFLNAGHMDKEASLAYYYLTLSLYQTTQEIPNSLLDVNSIFSNLTPFQRRTLRNVLVTMSLQHNKPMQAFSYLEGSPGKLVEGEKNQAVKVIRYITSIEDINELLHLYSVSQIYSNLRLRYVSLLLQKDEYEEAKSILDKIDIAQLEMADQTSYYRLRNYTDMHKVHKHKIGVLLPLSSPNLKRIAQQTLRGLELAIRNLPVDGGKWTLVIRDTNLELPSRLTQSQKYTKIMQHMHELVQDLAETEKVMAIVGPLRRDFTKALTATATEYQVPIISFSLTEDIAKDSDFLFRFQAKRTLQAKTIADYAIDYLQAKHFVLLSPSDAQNKAVTAVFAKEVEARGGKIVGARYFDSNARDFQDEFSSFTGGYREIDSQEAKELRYLHERKEPVIDFDAVFAPVPVQMAHSLSAFRNLFNVQDAWLLGMNGFNTRRIQTFSDNLRIRFVDSFPYSAISLYSPDFYNQYWKVYNFDKQYTEPTSYTIYSYEIVEIINRLYQEGSTTSLKLQEQLQSLQKIPVLTGSASYLGNGEIAVPLHIFKVKGEKVLFVISPSRVGENK